MPSSENLDSRTRYHATTSRIVRAQDTKLGRQLMSDVNVCIDPKLENVRGDAQASPGGSPVWGDYLGRPAEKTAARLRGNGVRATSWHENCGMAKVAAEKALRHPVSQSEADQWAKDVHTKFGRDHGFGVIGFRKCDMCEPDNTSIHIIRPGVKNVPTRGFRINSITQNPVEAEKVARMVADSRGIKNPITIIHTASQRDAEKMKHRLGHGNVRTVIAPRRS